MNKQLNTSCDLSRLLVCQLPEDVVEVELKVKTKWGKHTLIEDQHSRTERYYPWDRADHRVRIHSKRRKMPHHAKSNDNIDNPTGNSKDSTDSGTDIPMCKGLGYPPLIFTDPEVAEKLTNSDTGHSETEGPQIPSIGDYCRTCISKWSRCICKSGSDWDENPIDITTQISSPSNRNRHEPDWIQ